MTKGDNKEVKKTNIKQASIILIIVLLEIMIPSILGAKLVTVLFLTWPTIYLLCKLMKFDWKPVITAAFDGIRNTMGTFMLLASVGLMVASLVISGALPTIVYYGLHWINPHLFLLCTILINFVMAAAMGTSFGAAASSGVAMMSIGLTMKINPGMTAAAVMCGVMFGERCSPMSSTSNTVAAVCQIDILKHIRSMMNTMAIPFIATCIIFTFLGLHLDTSSYTPTVVNNISSALTSQFKISIITLIPLVIVIICLVLKVGSLLSLMFGTVTGGLIAITFQRINWINTINYIYTGFISKSNNSSVNHLLEQGGMKAMVDVFFLLFFAIGMGAMLDKLGVTQVFVNSFKDQLNNTPKLIIATMLFSYFGSIVTCASSPGHVIVGTLLKPLYDDKRIDRRILARTMEDCGTMGALMIPWNVFSVYFMGCLGVTYSQYIPYIYISFLIPIMTLFYAFTGLTIKHITKAQAQQLKAKA